MEDLQDFRGITSSSLCGGGGGAQNPWRTTIYIYMYIYQDLLEPRKK